MGVNRINNNLYSYFTEKNIKIVNHSFENRETISLESVKRQIDNIIVFQTLSKGYKDNILPRICGSIGKDLESYKVQIKTLELDLDSRSEKIDKNSVDTFILEYGDSILSQAKRSVIQVENSNYTKLIRRSMSGYEVCLGRVGEGNLRVNESGEIEVGSIKYLTYNLIEHDFYSYLKRIIRKNRELNVEYLIELFVEKSLLTEDSSEYLNGLILYPLESLRLWDKYRKNKKRLTEEEYIERFYTAKINNS